MDGGGWVIRKFFFIQDGVCGRAKGFLAAENFQYSMDFSREPSPVFGINSPPFEIVASSHG